MCIISRWYLLTKQGLHVYYEYSYSPISIRIGEWISEDNELSSKLPICLIFELYAFIILTSTLVLGMGKFLQQIRVNIPCRLRYGDNRNHVWENESLSRSTMFTNFFNITGLFSVSKYLKSLSVYSLSIV